MELLLGNKGEIFTIGIAWGDGESMDVRMLGAHFGFQKPGWENEHENQLPCWH
jgi:hypothetical protein